MLLVILIFLMVTTTYQRVAELQITLPEADAEQPKQRPKEINVGVDAQGRYVIDRTVFTFTTTAALADALKSAAGDAKDPVVVINADANATHQSVIHVMEAARAAGFVQITFATQTPPPASDARAPGTDESRDASPTASSTAWYARRTTLLSALLLPLSLVFAAAVALRAFAYRAACCGPVRLPVPVVVVGNITVGGTGKTPLVVALALALAATRLPSGHRVSRGYGATVTTATAARSSPDDDPRRVGDEPLLLARAGVPVVVARDRVAAGRALLAAHPACDVILADDGLQHYGSRATSRSPSSTARAASATAGCCPPGRCASPHRALDEVDAVVALAAARRAAPGRRRCCADASTMTLVAIASCVSTDRSRTSTRVGVAAGHGARGGRHRPPAALLRPARAMGIEAVPHAFPDHHAFVPRRPRLRRRGRDRDDREGRGKMRAIRRRALLVRARHARGDRSRARRPDRWNASMDAKLLEILVCPVTKGPLIYDRERQELVSRSARLAYPIRDGIPVMLEDEARKLTPEREWRRCTGRRSMTEPCSPSSFPPASRPRACRASRSRTSRASRWWCASPRTRATAAPRGRGGHRRRAHRGGGARARHRCLPDRATTMPTGTDRLAEAAPRSGSPMTRSSSTCRATSRCSRPR